MKPKYIKHYNNKIAIAREYFGKTFVYRSAIGKVIWFSRINNKKRIKRRNNLIDRVCKYRFRNILMSQTKGISISLDLEKYKNAICS